MVGVLVLCDQVEHRLLRGAVDRGQVRLVTQLRQHAADREAGVEAIEDARIDVRRAADGRRWIDVRSEDINGYIKMVASEDFSAKAFRTWNATVLAAVALAVSGPAGLASKTARKRAIRSRCPRWRSAF